MNALEALGYMAVEVGRIIQVRNKKLGIVIIHEDLIEGRSGLVLCSGDINSNEWEIGWSCVSCCESGTITMHCNTPFEEEVLCADCENGIRWETEY